MARQGATLRSVNAVRCILVLGLIAFQSVEVSETYGRIAGTALWVVPGWSVAALFALAGFTAMRSVERNGAATAFMRTAVRFLPVLVVLVVATAYGLGTITTADSRGSYLRDTDVASYLLNIVGLPQFALPGVFQFNAAAGVVNAILWIIPVAYLAAALLWASGWRAAWRTRVLGAGGVILAASGIGLFAAGIDLGSPDRLPALLLAGKGLSALLCFVAGAVMYRLRGAVPIDWRVATAAGVLTALVALLGSRSWLDNALVSVATAVPIAYLAVYACSLGWPLRHSAAQAEPVLWRMLLLAYPVQQTCVAFGPDRQSGIVNLALALPVIVLLAASSWWLVERPVLRRFLPTLAPRVDTTSARRRFSTTLAIERGRAMLPIAAGAVVVVLLVLAALALTMLAMQRDAGGA